MKSFLDKSEDKSQRISVSEYNKELEEAERRISRGEFTTQEALREKAKKWVYPLFGTIMPFVN